jgi:hypothetical protein
MFFFFFQLIYIGEEAMGDGAYALLTFAALSKINPLSIIHWNMYK